LPSISFCALKTDRTPAAEVAVLTDEESFFYESDRYDLDLATLSHQVLQGLARFGAPFDHYLLNDFVEGRVRPYKLYIFLNAFHLDRARREKLKHIGKGKAQSIKDSFQEQQVTSVISDNELSPAQGRNLEHLFSRKVLDRTQLIRTRAALRAFLDFRRD
jgi:hypothetical protein